MILPIWGVSPSTIQANRQHAFVVSRLGGFKSLCGVIRTETIAKSAGKTTCELCDFKEAADRRKRRGVAA